MKIYFRLTFFIIILLISVKLSAQNNCIDFDGEDDFAVIPANSFINNLTFTVEFWVKLDDVPLDNQYDGIVDKGRYSGSGYNKNDWYFLALKHKNKLKIEFGSIGLDDPMYFVINDNNWHHIVALFDGCNYKTYLDGVLKETSPGTYCPKPTNGIALGRCLDYSYYFNGHLDELRIWNDGRTQEEIRQNMYREIPNPTSETSLVAYYPLNGDLNDASVNANNASIAGGSISYVSSSSLYGPKNCLNFDGSNDFVSIPDNSAHEPSSLTLEAWVYVNGESLNQTGPDNLQYVIFKQNSRDNVFEGYTIIYNEDQSCFEALISSKNGTKKLISSNNVNYGKWNHLAFSADNSAMKLYLNGILNDTSDTGFSLDYGDKPLFFGSTNSLECDGFFNGKIDEIRIWDEVRTISQIQENMCKSLTGNEEHIVAYYNFDNVEESLILQDYSSNFNDGSLINMDSTAWISSSAFNTWLNTNDKTWTTPTNWSRETVPATSSPFDNIGIYNFGGNVPIIPTAQVVENFFIGNGITEVLNSNKTLDIKGNFINNGIFTLESNASANASLIINGNFSNNGIINSQSYLNGNAKSLHMISSPSKSVDISESSFFPGADDDFYAWYENTPGVWVNYKNTSVSPTFIEVNGSDNFIPAKGYLIAYNQENPLKNFTGDLNTGDINYKLLNSNTKDWTYNSGWNLIGNPYSSSIDWSLVDKSQFQDNFAYIYDPNKDGGEGYIIVNGGDTNAYIAPHQGFFVLANTDANNQNFTFTNSIQTHANSQSLKNANDDDELVLKISYKNYYDETKIISDENSEFNRDRKDALKKFSFNTEIPQIFSISYDEVSLVLNSIPEINNDKNIPLGMFFPENDLYSISLTYNNEIIGENGIYLKDKYNNVIHELSDSEYNFSADAGNNIDRFTLYFGLVGIDEYNNSLSDIKIWAFNKTINILNPKNIKGKIKLINIYGQIIREFKLDANKKQIIPLNLNTGNYIVNVISDKEFISKKVFIK